MLEVIVLGNSGATPAYNRHPTSQLLKSAHTNFLIDCGEGTQMQLLRYKIKTNKIHHIFISHLHGDHYLGLMGLISTMHMNQRDKDLHLYAPRGLAEIIKVQLRHSNSRLSYRIFFHEINPHQSEIIFQEDGISVQTLLLNHKIDCTGFLFRELVSGKRKIIKDKIPENLALDKIIRLKNGLDVLDEEGKIELAAEEYTFVSRSASYAYCSDTAYHEPLIEQVAEVDLLYHESTFLEEDFEKADQTFHSTARQAALIAQKAHVGRLMLGHFSARYKDLNFFLEEARIVFPDTIISVEGQRVFVPEDIKQ